MRYYPKQGRKAYNATGSTPVSNPSISHSAIEREDSSSWPDVVVANHFKTRDRGVNNLHGGRKTVLPLRQAIDSSSDDRFNNTNDEQLIDCVQSLAISPSASTSEEIGSSLSGPLEAAGYTREISRPRISGLRAPVKRERIIKPPPTLENPLMEYLKTPFCDVFVVKDGIFVEPDYMYGVQRGKLVETVSENWLHDWKTFRNVIDGRREQELELERDTLAATGKTKFQVDQAKKKLTRLRSQMPGFNKWFGPETDRHPNQVLRPSLQPIDGISASLEAVHKLCVLLNSLEKLKRERILVMEPWDFLRWRIGWIARAQPRPSLCVKTTVHHIASVQKREKKWSDDVVVYAVNLARYRPAVVKNWVSRKQYNYFRKTKKINQ